jgi:hypothetical protein
VARSHLLAVVVASVAALALVGVLGACKHHAVIPADPKPTTPLFPVPAGRVCVTRGAMAGSAVTVPTFRAVATATTGDAVSLAFTYRGDSDNVRALASGKVRRQLGLKLRAANGCNLVYAMWRLDPHPELEVSVKRNPGMRTHKECGAEGYTKLKPAKKLVVPGLHAGETHTLHAEITGDVLAAWIDGQLALVGELPDEARDLMGPAGVRSDNVKFDLVQLKAVAMVGGGDGAPTDEPKCTGSGSSGSSSSNASGDDDDEQ